MKTLLHLYSTAFYKGYNCEDLTQEPKQTILQKYNVVDLGRNMERQIGVKPMLCQDPLAP
jgi:hypothetical protein